MSSMIDSGRFLGCSLVHVFHYRNFTGIDDRRAKWHSLLLSVSHSHLHLVCALAFPRVVTLVFGSGAPLHIA